MDNISFGFVFTVFPPWNPCWTSWFLLIHVCKKGSYMYLEDRLNSNAHVHVAYQNCVCGLKRRFRRTYLLERMETQLYSILPIQSSGIVQNNQMICILLLTPPENYVLFELKECWAAGSLLHCCIITHHMDQNRKKKETGGYWIEGIERKFRLKFTI